MLSTDKLVVCLPNIDGYVGRHTDEFDGIHGKLDIKKSNNTTNYSAWLDSPQPTG